MASLYEGYYAPFKSASKSQGAILLGADCIVGDRCAIELKTEEGATTAWVYNRFGGEMGFLDAAETRRIHLAAAHGSTTIALLASVFYVNEPDPGYYGGELAIVNIDPSRAESLERYISYVGEKLADGMRPAIELSDPEIASLMADPSWHPAVSPATKMPVEGAVAMKTRRTMTESIVEQGRKKNPGCYIASIVILALAIAGIVYAVMGFFA